MDWAMLVIEAISAGSTLVWVIWSIARATSHPNPSDDLVYVTGHGKRYHREHCPSAKNATGIPTDQAHAAGCTPCDRCYKKPP